MLHVENSSYQGFWQEYRKNLFKGVGSVGKNIISIQSYAFLFPFLCFFMCFSEPFFYPSPNGGLYRSRWRRGRRRCFVPWVFHSVLGQRPLKKRFAWELIGSLQKHSFPFWNNGTNVGWIARSQCNCGKGWEGGREKRGQIIGNAIKLSNVCPTLNRFFAGKLYWINVETKAVLAFYFLSELQCHWMFSVRKPKSYLQYSEYEMKPRC